MSYTLASGARHWQPDGSARARCVFSSQTSLTPGVPASDTLSSRAPTRLLPRLLANPLRPVLDALSCALYPTDCLVCLHPLLRLSSAPVCDSCWDRLRPQTATLCLRCGDDLGIAAFSTGTLRSANAALREEDQFCQPCRLVPPAFVRAVAFGVYDAELRALIHLLKYRRIPPLARGLGRRLAETLSAIPGLPSELAVIPVPLHRARRRQRGFNHAELIARALASALRALSPERRLTLVPSALARIRATESQAALSPRQRRQNLQGAFAVPRPERVAGLHILLVDDIYTTGATARAASRVLLRAGAASVWVATVARAQREGVALWDADRTLGSQPPRTGQHPHTGPYPRTGSTRDSHV